MNFNKYNGLKLPYDPVLLGDINSIDSIRDRLMREAPLAQNTGQSAYNTREVERLQRRYRKMQSSKSPVTPRPGANEQGGNQMSRNCVSFALRMKIKYLEMYFVRQVLITLKRLRKVRKKSR